MNMKAACLCIGIAFGMSWAQRNMENLDRGLVAVKTSGGVFLSWRVLGTDAKSTGFNLYRNGVKVNSSAITGATNLTDSSGTTRSTYTVKPVISGVEGAVGSTATVWADPYLTINLDRPAGGTNSSGSYTYSPNDIAVGDLDGDGQYELVVKWDPSDSKDNSLKGYTGDVYVDAYKLNGKKLWRIDLGKNIRAGAHYTQILVGDYDNDGKAEVAMKTAPGTKDGTGAYLSKGAAAGADNTADYRNSSGYILSGPEYLTIFNGQTGKEMVTVNYNPGRGTVSAWGDSYGNRVDRFLATNAYLDGKTPSMVFQRGYYTRMTLAAWDWDGTTLKQRWFYDANTSGKECYGQGNHNLAAGDVDGDGKDEVIEGACAVDHNGTIMYRTGLGHGDAMHLGDFDPDRAGLEVYEVHELTDATYGYEMHDAKTGQILWGAKTGTDNGRGLAADIDSTYRGTETWSFGASDFQTDKGVNTGKSRGPINFRIYWDGDLQDEVLDNVTISKWNGSKFVTLQALPGQSCNTTKATPNFSGDLFGDWREEVITNDGASKLYVYTTTIPTKYRLYTLAHDPLYRNGMSFQNAAYNQPPYLGFWLGRGIDSVPTPNIVLVGAKSSSSAASSSSISSSSNSSPTSDTASITKHGAGASSQTILKGDSIVALYFSWLNATNIKVSGIPTGLTAVIDSVAQTVSFAGVIRDTGVYTYTLTTVGAKVNATRTGVFTVVVSLTNLSSSSISNLSSSVAVSSSAATVAVILDQHLMNSVGTYQVYDLLGHLHSSSVMKPVALPQGRWVVVALDARGNRIGSWQQIGTH